MIRTTTAVPKLSYYTWRQLESLPQLAQLPKEQIDAMQICARVLPFRVNNYVVEELIDWDDVPNDPIFQLTFPQRGMLHDEHFDRMRSALQDSADPAQVRETAETIRRELNPHPEGQLTHNVPQIDDEPVVGVQHKYRETCLVFPSAGQTCHSYCTFCFRWAQFVGMPDLKFATDQAMRFRDYIKQHHEITDVLITGGDPMVMSADVLARYIEPLLGPEFDHIQTIRIGSKALSYWPHRFLTDKDSDALIQLLETCGGVRQAPCFDGPF